MLLFNKYLNRYDYYIIALIAVLCFGSIGGALEVVRVLSILLSPLLFKTIKMQGFGYARSLRSMLVLMYLYFLFSFIWTPDKIQAIKELVYYVIHFLLFLELIVFARFASDTLRSISIGWLLAVVFCSIVACWELYTGNHLRIAVEQDGLMNVGGEALEHFTASVTFMNYNGFNTFLCFGFPWVFYLLLDDKSPLALKVLSFISLVLSLLFIVVNASRGGLLSVMIMIVVYFFLSKKTFRKSIIIILGLIVIGYYLINYGDAITTVMVARAADGGMFTDDARTTIWSTALSVLYNSYGFGSGVGGLSAGMARYAKLAVTAPHNMFLEILCQYGIIIFLIVVIFILKQFQNVKKQPNNNIIVIMMAIISMPFYSIINSTYLLDPTLYVLMASIYIFSNYKIIKRVYPSRSV